MSGRIFLQLTAHKAMEKALKLAQKWSSLEGVTPVSATETYTAKGHLIGATAMYDGYTMKTEYTCNGKPISVEHAEIIINNHIASL